MQHGREVGLDPSNIVRSDSAPLPKMRAEPSNFRLMPIVAKWLDASGYQLYVVGLSPGDIVLDGDPALPSLKDTAPPIFGSCPLWPNGWMD